MNFVQSATNSNRTRHTCESRNPESNSIAGQAWQLSLPLSTSTAMEYRRKGKQPPDLSFRRLSFIKPEPCYHKLFRIRIMSFQVIKTKKRINSAQPAMAMAFWTFKGSGFPRTFSISRNTA
jgi:hypothetical protein